MFKTLGHHLHLGCATALMLFVGCGDSGAGDGDTQASETAAETAAETAETAGSGSGNEANSEGVDGDGDGDDGTGPGDGDGDTGPGDGDGDTGPGDGDGDTSPGDGDGDTGDGDGDPIVCADFLDKESCDASIACQSVSGQPLVEGLGAPCLDPAVFLGCIDEMPCDQALTWFCIGPEDTKHLVQDGCGPEGEEPCEAPLLPPSECMP
ncbi:hypothetical protein DB30_04956 [Enhygromyxa salina]|uniref:Endo-1,4-beta-xylanase A n=2 Tax=Enhygromyxa salina TaxID=215803 RepID=A0A0C1ZEI3_9BACT|nr:hypothetical protein DB30_04956 [Enhygromyxa salina]